jgi:hypothetical protein
MINKSYKKIKIPLKSRLWLFRKDKSITLENTIFKWLINDVKRLKYSQNQDYNFFRKDKSDEMKNIFNLLSVLVISLLFYLGSLLWIFSQNNTFSKTFGESEQFKKFMKK